MFKVSVKHEIFSTFVHWTEIFDTFCVEVKNEDTLDKYSDLLEENNDGILDSFDTLFDKVNKKTRLIIEGSKDCKTIKFSTLDNGKEKLCFVVDENGVTDME